MQINLKSVYSLSPVVHLFYVFLLELFIKKLFFASGNADTHSRKKRSVCDLKWHEFLVITSSVSAQWFVFYLFIISSHMLIIVCDKPNSNLEWCISSHADLTSYWFKFKSKDLTDSRENTNYFLYSKNCLWRAIKSFHRCFWLSHSHLLDYFSLISWRIKNGKWTTYTACHKSSSVITSLSYQPLWEHSARHAML